MLWLLIMLLSIITVSLLLDLVDLESAGNRVASIIIRGLSLVIALIAIIETYA